MKKCILAAVAVALSIPAVYARRAILQGFYDPQTRLIDPAGALHTLFFGTIAAALVLAVLAALTVPPNEKSGSARAAAVFFALAAAAFAYGGLRSFLGKAQALQTLDIVLYGLLAFSVLVLCLMTYGLFCGKAAKTATFSALPVFWTCFLLYTCYRQNEVTPQQIEQAAILLLALMAFGVAALFTAKRFCGRKNSRILLFSAFLGVFFAAITAFGDTAGLSAAIAMRGGSTDVYTYALGMLPFCLGAMLLPPSL